MNKWLLSFLVFFLIFLTLRFFHNSIFTALLILIIISLFLMARKEIKHVIVFYIVIITYLTLNYFNSLDFHSLVPGDFDYSISYESLQLLKFSIPLIFYLLIKNNFFAKVSHSKILKGWTIFIVLNILILNLLKLSYSSYNDELISGSILDWGSGVFTYYELASKGWFIYGNQITLLLILLFGYFLYNFFSEQKDYRYLVILGITGVVIGTRISTLLPILLFFITILLYTLKILIKKEGIAKGFYPKSIVFVVLISVFIYFSPSMIRIDTYDMNHLSSLSISQSNTVAINNSSTLVNEEENKKDYILNNYKEKLINEQFILNSYPYQYDPDFWLKIMDSSYDKRIDYRFLEISMVKRVYEINDNKMDYLFGIGSSRVFNIWNIERDFTMQFYSFGLVGLIIICYVYILIIKDLINNYKKSKDNKNLLSLFLLLLFFMISFLSGNILNSLAVTLMSIFIIMHRSSDY